MKFLIEISTDEAQPGELEEAIKSALSVLTMPNGDTLWLDNARVDFVTEKEPVSSTWPD